MATKDKSAFGAGKRPPLVDKMKAVYLYQLGPNSTTINTDYQEYFSNQTSRYPGVFPQSAYKMTLDHIIISKKIPMTNLLN